MVAQYFIFPSRIMYTMNAQNHLDNLEILDLCYKDIVTRSVGQYLQLIFHGKKRNTAEKERINK